jgi:glycosyltransferase involved in cell wall biosynthesis
MMTVLQVLEASEGGTRRHVEELVSALDPAEFRSALALSFLRDGSRRDDDLARYAARGVEVCEVPMWREIAPLADAESLACLVRCVRRVRPQVIHAHSSKAGFLARLAGAWCRVPVVYTPHVFPFLMACAPRRRRLYRWLERQAREWTAALVAVSEEERREARALGFEPERVSLIPNGVPPSAHEGPVRVREAGPLVVGFFGRLTAQKGPDLLLEAAHEVAAHLPHVTFFVYGSGEMEELLRLRAEELQAGDRVRFLGPCPDGEVIARMREADVVAVPSRWEGCPYVVLEAFQAGVPVVAAAVGGVPDLIRDRCNGVLVAPGSAEALEDGLLELLRDPQRRRRLAEQGRATLAGHRLDAMAASVAAVYRRVASEKQTTRRR